jgi:hypothetical protein
MLGSHDPQCKEYMIHNARFRYNGILFSLFRDLESKDQICTTCDQYERTLAKLKKENQELQDRYYILHTSYIL